MSHGEILNTLQERIVTAKKKKRLPQTDAVMLDVMELLVIYIQEDHAKVSTMWSVFRPMAWAMGIFITAVIAGAASGKIEIIIR